MAEETKEAPSFVPAAPPPPRRVRDRSSFSQSEAPLATEAPAATRGSLFSVASSGSRRSDAADSTISFNYDDDDDAEAPAAPAPAPAPASEGFFARLTGTAKSTPEEDVFDETTDLAATAEDEPLMRKSLSQRERYLPRLGSQISAGRPSLQVDRPRAGSIDARTALLTTDDDGDDKYRGSLWNALKTMGLSSTANKKSKDKVLGLRAVEAKTTIHGARGHVGYGRNRRKSEAHSYVAPRVDHQVSKPWTGRVLYTLALLNIVVWLPVWLKLISIERQYLPNTPVSVFNGNVGLELKVPSFDPDYVAKVHAKRDREEGRDGAAADDNDEYVSTGVKESTWYDGTYTTGYWDCCKPSCSWPGKGLVDSPVRACSAETGKVTLDFNEGSVCDGGTAASCTSNRPWTHNDGVSLGFAAASTGGHPYLNGDQNCGQCFELVWTDEQHSYGGGAHSDIVGKSHIIQVTNIGYDVSGDHSFDLQIPGAGQGIFDTGCAAQFENVPAQGTSWDTEDFDCGNNYGGCYDVNDCDSLPDDTDFPPGSGPDLRDGCKWRFGDAYKQHDNPQSEPDPTNNPYVRFRRVKCPSALTNITWSIPLDDDDYPSVDLDSYASDYTHPPTLLPTLTPAPSPQSANTSSPTPRPVPKPTPAPTPWDGPSELCEVCPNGQDVTFPVSAEVTNFTSSNIPDVRSASYVTLYASFDFSDWFQVSHSGVFTGLRDALNQTVDVCTDPPPELDDFVMGASAGSKITSYQQAVEATTDTSATTTKGTQTEMVSDIQPILDDEFQAFLDYERDLVDGHLSTCCIGMPTYTYLVACLTPEYPHDITENFWYYQPQRGPPFDDRCVAIGSKCGGTCGKAARNVVEDEEFCVDGEIPMDKLVSERTAVEWGITEGPQIKKRQRKRWVDGHFDLKGWKYALHVLFVLMMTIMGTSAWVTFLPGTGVNKDPLPPTMREVEDHMELNAETQNPLCLVAFSISASEPRMMVLRNLVGKMMAWVVRRKFVFESQAMTQKVQLFEEESSLKHLHSPTRVRISEDKNMAYTERLKAFYAKYDPMKVDGVAVLLKKYKGKEEELMESLIQKYGPEPPPRSQRELRRARKESSQTISAERRLDEYVEMIDIFQDEGHRVGAFALWAAFVNVVDHGDLRFLAKMAEKMKDMDASVDTLDKELEEGVLLDDSLRSLIGDYGVSREDAQQLELAFYCFDLLNALGHHCFWYSDPQVKVVGMCDLAGNEDAERCLRNWARNWRSARKKGLHPFSPGVAPMDDPAISRRVWDAWYELYNEQGRTKWPKRFDFTQFRTAEVHYYSDAGERGDLFRTVVMCYSARANPEDIKRASGFKVREVRGVRVDTFVRLKDETNGGLICKTSQRMLTYPEARRCHARVVGFASIDGVKHVKLKECTPELLAAMPDAAFHWRGSRGCMETLCCLSEEKRDSRITERGKASIHEAKKRDFEAVLPIDVVEPLRECRGKSGGMNHAVAVVNGYLHHYSRTMRRVRKRRDYALKEDDAKQVGHLLFAIFDCRHMALEGFWDSIVPQFYRYTNPNNPWSAELEINPKVAFVQLPQTFTGLSIREDFFDMRNEYLFRMANTVRTGVGAITSCGTNAVWNYPLLDATTPLAHKFNEETMIEDTASSHEAIVAGRKGVYLFKRLVLGARKGTADYVAAVFRWSKGAVQLSWTSFWFPLHRYLYPWLVLFFVVAPIMATVIYFQATRLDHCHRTKYSSKMWEKVGVSTEWCRLGPTVGLISDPIFVCYGIYMVLMSIASFNNPRIGANLIMFENITYFFSSQTAYFWLAIPCVMTMAPDPSALTYDAVTLTIGGLWVEVHMNYIYGHIAAWAPLENNQAPDKLGLLRAQQMFFVTAPLHTLAIFQGTQDSWKILFAAKDASRWASFDSINAITTAKLWVLTMMVMLSSSIVVGLVRIGTAKKPFDEIERWLGVVMSLVFLSLTAVPSAAMFFHKKVTSIKAKPSLMDRCTAGVFGKALVITPSLFYMFLYSAAIVVLLALRGRARNAGF